MKDRFKNNLYTKEILVIRNHRPCYITGEGGTLYSGHHRTKILPEDLPAWYVYGRYYKCWGYLSTKGISDLRYVPSRFSNHFLKDDCLYIAYGGKIKEVVPQENESHLIKYTGFDERIWGGEIISVIQGARLHSNYDISGLIQQLKEKKEWLVKAFPAQFGPDKWHFDVDKCFSDALCNEQPPK